jgi:hypothetical protein
LGKEVALMRRILLLITVAAIMAGMMAAMAGSAAASKPIVVEDTITGEAVVVEDCSKFGFDDFQVLDRFVLNSSAKEFYDENGELVRVVEQINGTDTFVNSKTGKQFTSRFQNTEHIDATAQTITVTGVIGRLTVPGSGAVLLDVGRIVIDLAGEEPKVTFQAGPHQLVEGDDLAELCEALE